MALTDIANGAIAQASDVQQIIDLLKGTAGKGVPLSLTAINDALNYALAVRNNDTGASKAFIVYKADGTVLFQIDKNGVIASADGTTAAAQIPTLTATQTLTNKTLTNPHFTTPVVDSGGLAVNSGGISLVSGNMALTTGQYIGNGNARIRCKDLGTIASAGTAAVDDVAASLGLLIVVYGGGAIAGYALNGGAHTVTLLFGPGGTFSTTFNNAGTVNVYWNTSDYFLQNNTGSSNQFSTFLLATG